MKNLKIGLTSALEEDFPILNVSDKQKSARQLYDKSNVIVYYCTDFNVIPTKWQQQQQHKLADYYLKCIYIMWGAEECDFNLVLVIATQFS